jgi:glycerate-2-kinase
VFLSGGTDGNDGPTDAAGAIVDLELGALARASGIDADAYLANNDSYSFFERVGGLLKTGPTNTNVCDIQVLLVCG